MLNYQVKYLENIENIENLLLIDSTIKDYQEVVDSVNYKTMAIVYDYDCTFEDLRNAINELKINRIGIFCHLNAPFFKNQQMYEDVSGMINFIDTCSIKNIDFLACSTLNSEEYKIFYAKLPCIVGASNDETGNIKYGGDWIMESTNEDIESIYFTKNIEYYTYLLSANITITGISDIEVHAIYTKNLELVMTSSDPSGTLCLINPSVFDNVSYSSKLYYKLLNNYIAYGIGYTKLSKNTAGYFLITSNNLTPPTYYLSYIQYNVFFKNTGLIAPSLGSTIGSIATGTTGSTSLHFAILENVDKYSGIVISETSDVNKKIIYIGLTNGYVMTITIQDTVANTIPSIVTTNLTWCSTGTSPVYGITQDNYNLYAINSLGQIFKIYFNTGVSAYFATVENGTSLNFVSNWLYVGVQTTLPSGASYGSGVIKKIQIYANSLEIVTQEYSSSYTIAHFGVSTVSSQVYVCPMKSSGNRIFGRYSINTASNGVSYSIIGPTVTSIPFKFLFNGEMIDLHTILVQNTTNNLNNMNQNSNYFILNNVNPLDNIYVNSIIGTPGNVPTNYYIKDTTSDNGYRDINYYFNIISYYQNYSTSTPIYFDNYTTNADLNIGTGTFKISYIANNTPNTKFYNFNAPITSSPVYLGVLCMGGGGNGNTVRAGGGGSFCYSEVLLIGGKKYFISVGGVASATIFKDDTNSIIANGGKSANGSTGGVGGIAYVTLGTNSFTKNGNNSGIKTTIPFNATTCVNTSNPGFYKWLNENATAGTSNVVCGGGGGGIHAGNAAACDANGITKNGTSKDAQSAGSVGGGYSNGAGGGSSAGTGGGGIIYLYQYDTTSDMTPFFDTPDKVTKIPDVAVTTGRSFYYIMNNGATSISTTIKVPFTVYAYIILIGGGGKSFTGGSGDRSGRGGGFFYGEMPLFSNTTYTATVGGLGLSTSFTSITGAVTSTIVANHGSASSSGAAADVSNNYTTTSNPILIKGEQGSGTRGATNILKLNINSDLKTDMSNNSTIPSTLSNSYDNNIPIGCGARGYPSSEGGNVVKINKLGDAESYSGQYVALYNADPASNRTGRGTGNGGGGNGSANNGGGGMIIIYF